MSLKFDIVTFDCYGTLIDWERGMRAAFASILARSGSAATADEAVEIYGAIEPEVQRGGYQSYRDVLDEAAARTLAAIGIEHPPDARFLSDSLPSWRPFADTNPALERLRAGGIRLGLLSNIDDDLLTETRKHFTVDFDLLITAQRVRSYKPAEGHFIAARSAIGAARWLHAAQSNFHDIVPANRLGIPSAWINRKGEAALPGGEPHYEFHDLTELADAMTGLSQATSTATN
jgi:2-haloalkanoic acid dehalogenase type II